MKTLVLTALCTSLAIPAAHAREDILTTAASNGSFDTLVSLVVAAGLDDALQGDGSFTVFAPTDEAFAALPAGALESLRANREQLAAVLKYHVLPRVIRIPEHPPAHRVTEAATLQGQELAFRRDGTHVFVNDAEVVLRDLRCTNGIVHVIDRVLMPPPATPDLVELARSAGGFSTLLAAAEAAGLAEALSSESDLTLLAPTDEAFAALPAGTVERLLLPENRAKLAGILKDHVLPGRLTATDLAALGRASALSGRDLSFRIRSGGLEAAGARVTRNDLEASNGLIHVIDRVILLDAPAASSGAAEHASELPGLIEIRATWRDNVVRDGVRAKRVVIRCTGGGSVRLTGVEANEIETRIGGGGSVILSGSAGRHVAAVSGGATLMARELETRATSMNVNGGGDATVLATEELSFSASSGTTVRYVDTGAKVESRANRYAKVEVLPAAHVRAANEINEVAR